MDVSSANIQGMLIGSGRSYPTETIAGHTMISLPGGFFVVGTRFGEHDDLCWVSLSPFSISKTAVTEDQYRQVMGRPGNPEALPNQPVTMVSFHHALDYIQRANERYGTQLFLPSAAQREFAARGPAENISALSETNGVFDFRRFQEVIGGRFENLVFGTLGAIFNDEDGNFRDGTFERLIRQGFAVYGWRLYATASGMMSDVEEGCEEWWERGMLPPADWFPAGKPHPFGMCGMTGGGGEWVQDKVPDYGPRYPHGAIDPIVTLGIHEHDERRLTVGSSCACDGSREILAGYFAWNEPDEKFIDLTFRVATASAITVE